MAGRPKRIRNINSYVNHIDANTAAGPMKMGTAPRVGVTRNFWHNYQAVCHQSGDSVKQSYRNVVALGINPARTPVGTCFNVERSCAEELVPSMFPTPDSGGGGGTCQQCPTGPTGPTGGSSDDSILTINGIGPDMSNNFEVDASNGIAIGGITNGIYISNTEGAAPFVVDKAGRGTHTTIQSAINAAALIATGASPQLVYIWGGAYVENLTLAPYVHLTAYVLQSVGITGNITYTSPAAANTIIIYGVSMLATTGNLLTITSNFITSVTLYNCTMSAAAGNVIVSTGTGPSPINLQINNCQITLLAANTNRIFNTTFTSLNLNFCTIANNNTLGTASRSTISNNIVNVNNCTITDSWILNTLTANVNNCNWTLSPTPTNISVFNLTVCTLNITNTSITSTSVYAYWVDGTVGTVRYSGITTINNSMIPLSSLTLLPGTLQSGNVICNTVTCSGTVQSDIVNCTTANCTTVNCTNINCINNIGCNTLSAITVDADTIQCSGTTTCNELDCTTAVNCATVQCSGTMNSQNIVTQPETSAIATGQFNISPIVIGTPKQNILGYDIQVNFCVIVSNATNGYIEMGVGDTSPPSVNIIMPPFSVATSTLITFTAIIPAGYYILINMVNSITVDSITAQVCPI